MTDPRQFNIRNGAGELLCPACGFPNFATEEAYDERGGLIGITICPCCLWEPGFDDDHLASGAPDETIGDLLRAYRSSWDQAPKWQGRKGECPPNWDGRQQLAELFQVAPEVR